MSQRYQERKDIEPALVACLVHLKRTFGMSADSVAVRIALETFAFRVLSEDRARRAPPLPPPEALAARSPLREEHDPHDRPTVPTGLHGLRKPPGAAARKPTPKGVFDGP